MAEREEVNQYNVDKASPSAYDNLGMSDKDLVTSQIHILEKHTEPEKRFLQDDWQVNRNNVLGNITKEDLPLLANKRHVQKIIQLLPYDHSGGVGCIDCLSELLNDDIHWFLSTSPSVNGMARTLAVTKISKNSIVDESQKSGIQGLFGKKTQ